MSWNYRIVKRQDGLYGLHEVYYNKAGEAWAMTENPKITYMAEPDDDPDLHEGPEDILETLKMMLHDAEKDCGERGVFMEPAEGGWAPTDRDEIDDLLDGESLSHEELGAKLDEIEAAHEVADSTKELAKQVADMKPDDTPVEEWAKKLADDVGNAKD